MIDEAWAYLAILAIGNPSDETKKCVMQMLENKDDFSTMKKKLKDAIKMDDSLNVFLNLKEDGAE